MAADPKAVIVPPTNPPRSHRRLRYPFLWLKISLLRQLLKSKYKRESTPDVVEVRDATIPSRDAGRTIKAIIYQAKGTQGAGKYLLNWHGSGSIFHNLGQDNVFCAFMADHFRAEGLTVVDLDYRKSPEHPFPAAHEDFEDAILHFAKLEGTTQLHVGGFSAGGKSAIAAAATTKAALQDSKIQVSSLLLFYPSLDYRPGQGQSIPAFVPRSGFVTPPWLVNTFKRALCVDRRSLYDKRVSPVLLQPEELPPRVFLLCGDADPYYESIRDFAHGLQSSPRFEKDGVEFVSINQEGHGWDKTPLCPETFEARTFAYEKAAAFLRKSLSSPSSSE
ncbi:hypothetical protein OC845_001051 [Tilletia horrida]|nr:hypothetical protein OC845_001051 [Tilletia horrida]